MFLKPRDGKFGVHTPRWEGSLLSCSFQMIKYSGHTSSSEEEEHDKHDRKIEGRSESSSSAPKQPLKSILKQRSESVGSSDDADDEAEDETTIFFTHSSIVPCHDDSILHPGNLHRLLSKYV